MTYIILRNSVQCNKCKDIIESKSRHDFVMCSCESTAIDGGKDYLRRLGNPEDYTDLSEVVSKEDTDWFEKVREEFTWKSYGKDGKGPKKDIPLKDLTNEHLNAILETQWHIRGSHVEEYMRKELEYRKVNNQEAAKK